jgi:hypothetical protein
MPELLTVGDAALIQPLIDALDALRAVISVTGPKAYEPEPPPIPAAPETKKSTSKKREYTLTDEARAKISETARKTQSERAEKKEIAERLERHFAEFGGGANYISSANALVAAAVGITRADISKARNAEHLPIERWRRIGEGLANLKEK